MSGALDAALARAALDASPDAFAAVDDDGRVVAYNLAAERLLGWTVDEVLGRRDPSVLDERRASYEAALDQLRDGPGASIRLAHRVTKDGREVLLAVTGYVRMPVDGGHVVGAFFRAAQEPEVRELRRNELSRALVEATRVDEILQAAHRHVVEVLGAHTAVVLTPCGRGHLHGEHAVGAHREDAESVELDIVPGGPWVVAGERGAAVGELAVGVHDAAPTLFVTMGPPKEQRVLAVVFEDEVPADPALRSVAGALADELWLALARADLIGELEGKVEILEATAAVASSVGLDLDDTMAAICRHAAEALSCERSGVYLRRGDGSLEVGALYATDIDISEPAGFQLADEVLLQGNPVLVQDADGCPFLDGPWHRSQGAISVYGMPLRVADREVGVLAVAHTEANPRGFTNLCQQVGGAVAQQAAIAIEHARLYRTELETVEQLRELDQLKADYVAGLTHDLRTPLTGLLGFTTTLRRLGDAVDESRRAEYLGAMERQAGRLVTMVEDMLLATRLEDGALRPSTTQRIDLTAIVAEALESFAPSRRARVRLRDVPLDVSACGDPTQLVRVVRNLIDNAIKYSPESEQVDVHVRAPGDHVQVVVRDRGPGVAAESIESVFERFRRGSLKERTDSSGLGLYISRGIARGHGGDVTYADADGGGAVFTLQLPARDDAC